MKENICYIMMLKEDISDNDLQEIFDIIEKYNNQHIENSAIKGEQLYDIKNVLYLAIHSDYNNEDSCLLEFINRYLSQSIISKNKISIFRFNSWNEVLTYYSN